MHKSQFVKLYVEQIADNIKNIENKPLRSSSVITNYQITLLQRAIDCYQYELQKQKKISPKYVNEKVQCKWEKKI